MEDQKEETITSKTINYISDKNMKRIRKMIAVVRCTVYTFLVLLTLVLAFFFFL